MKKAFCLLLALLLMAAAQLHLCARVSVDGEELPDKLSLSALFCAREAAAAAADEILTTDGAPPGVETRWCLSLSPPSQDAAPLSDLLLRHTEGVAVLYSGSVDGFPVACVSDRERLCEALRRQLYANRPAGAIHARYAEPIDVRPLYTRPDRESSVEDACLWITGMSRALYTDEDGRLIAG